MPPDNLATKPTSVQETNDNSPPHSDSCCPRCGNTIVKLRQLQLMVESQQRELIALREAAQTDELTGLANYRRFVDLLDTEMERTKRSGQATSLIMLDLDHFKAVNDNYGHDSGNKALQLTARLLRQAVRKLDYPCRYGGEEFAIILPTSDLLTASQVAERLRAQIETTPLYTLGHSIPLTASLGVATYSATDNDSVEAFVDRTDRLLYQSKQEGRNRVTLGIRSDFDDASHVGQEEKAAFNDLFKSEDQ